MLSSYSIVSWYRTVRQCSPSGGRWIGHWRTTWSTVCSSAPHSQAAEEAIPHLYKQEYKRPTPIGRRYSWTQTLLGRVIPGGGCRCRGWKCGVFWGCLPTPHAIGDPPSAPHICCSCQINWDVVRWVQMDVSHHASALDGRVSTEWSRCPNSRAPHAKDSVPPLRQSSAGWMSASATCNSLSNMKSSSQKMWQPSVFLNFSICKT